jgi:hypothetical protein
MLVYDFLAGNNSAMYFCQSDVNFFTTAIQTSTLTVVNERDDDNSVSMPTIPLRLGSQPNNTIIATNDSDLQGVGDVVLE